MILEREDGRLYYETYGRGDTIVFLNGFGSGINTWFPVIKKIKTKYNCVLYDYIGTGESLNFENYVFSLDSYCSDLHALIESIHDKKVHLVGYSMGGWIAQYFAAKWPSKVLSMTLINTSSKIFIHQNLVISHFIDVLRKSDISAFSKLMLLSCYSPEYLEKNSEKLEQLINLVVLTFAKQKKENWEELLESCLPFDSESSMGNIKIPVLLISGEHDFLCPKMTALRLQSLISDIKWTEIKSVGHAIPMESFQELGESIATFINGALNKDGCARTPNSDNEPLLL